MDLQEKQKRVEDFRLIDDIFFELFARDIPACQEIIRTILEDSKLIVENVVVQCSERNLYGRSVRLDALCTMGDGSLCNIEVQRSDNDDHLRRARFNASSITVRESEPGETFRDVKDVYIVYISEKDVIGDGLTTYHIDKVIRENDKIVDDGLHEIFVNTAVYDGSNIAELMQCFTQKNLNNPKFPAITRKFQELKTTEGGIRAMCELMERYNREAVKKDRIEKIQALLKHNCDKEFILSVGYSEEEYDEAEKVFNEQS